MKQNVAATEARRVHTVGGRAIKALVHHTDALTHVRVKINALKYFPRPLFPLRGASRPRDRLSGHRQHEHWAGLSTTSPSLTAVTIRQALNYCLLLRPYIALRTIYCSNSSLLVVSFHHAKRFLLHYWVCGSVHSISVTFMMKYF